MFEFNTYEANLHSGAIGGPSVPYQTLLNVDKISLLIWSEHCIECAAPACFQTCDLYQSRPDGLCRRFAYGMYKNPAFPTLRGYGAEVSFKKWAKMEARGNARMESVQAVLWMERIVALCTTILDAVGSLIGGISRDIRWNSVSRSLCERISRRLHSKHQGGAKPDVFMLEVYNPNDEIVKIQLMMTLAKEARAIGLDVFRVVPTFRTTISLEKGYSRHEFPIGLFEAVTESNLPFDIALIPEADTSVRLVFLTADFISYDKSKLIERNIPDIKCVVWDLDNTMWDGILVENDVVLLKPTIRDVLQCLDERGILLSIASKNDHGSASQQLESMGIAHYFLYPQINWRPKSDNVKVIAKQLNIGLDTFAFVDDNPFELDEVARSCPEVTCINARDIAGLPGNPRFKGSDSPDAKSRRQFYKEAIVRDEKLIEYGNDFFGFLASCEIKLDIQPYQSEYLDRVAELVQRTNQLNFSGQKYSRDQLYEVLCNDNLEKYVLHCADKYGSYGVVGFSVLSRDAKQLRVEDFMLSCRVQAKLIEQAFFAHLQSHHNPDNADSLWVNLRETSRNKPAQEVLRSLHFEKREETNGVWLDLRAHPLECHFIQVNCGKGTDREQSAG